MFRTNDGVIEYTISDTMEYLISAQLTKKFIAQ